jgi:hypothetical protein
MVPTGSLRKMRCRVAPFLEPGYIIPSIGNLADEKFCVSKKVSYDGWW